MSLLIIGMTNRSDHWDTTFARWLGSQSLAVVVAHASNTRQSWNFESRTARVISMLTFFHLNHELHLISQPFPTANYSSLSSEYAVRAASCDREVTCQIFSNKITSKFKHVSQRVIALDFYFIGVPSKNGGIPSVVPNRVANLVTPEVLCK